MKIASTVVGEGGCVEMIVLEQPEVARGKAARGQAARGQTARHTYIHTYIHSYIVYFVNVSEIKASTKNIFVQTIFNHLSQQSNGHCQVGNLLWIMQEPVEGGGGVVMTVTTSGRIARE